MQVRSHPPSEARGSNGGRRRRFSDSVSINAPPRAPSARDDPVPCPASYAKLGAAKLTRATVSPSAGTVPERTRSNSGCSLCRGGVGRSGPGPRWAWDNTGERGSGLRTVTQTASGSRLALLGRAPGTSREVPRSRRGRRRTQSRAEIAKGSTWRKGTRSRFRDPASRKRSPARSVRLVGAIRQPARRSRRRTRGELSFLLKRPSIPGTRMARR